MTSSRKPVRPKPDANETQLVALVIHAPACETKRVVMLVDRSKRAYQ